MKADSTPVSKSAPSSPLGLIGTRIDELQHSRFFQLFHLEAAEQPNAHTFAFRPSSVKFHAQVMVTAHTDATQRVNAIALVLTRAFIDHPGDGMFAADIGKSFLEVVLENKDREAVQYLIDTIAAGGHSNRPVIMVEYPEPRAHHIQRESPAYLAWLGHNPHWKQAFDVVSLELDNARIAGAKDLEIVVRMH